MSSEVISYEAEREHFGGGDAAEPFGGWNTYAGEQQAYSTSADGSQAPAVAMCQ